MSKTNQVFTTLPRPGAPHGIPQRPRSCAAGARRKFMKRAGGASRIGPAAPAMPLPCNGRVRHRRGHDSVVRGDGTLWEQSSGAEGVGVARCAKSGGCCWVPAPFGRLGRRDGGGGSEPEWAATKRVFHKSPNLVLRQAQDERFRFKSVRGEPVEPRIRWFERFLKQAHQARSSRGGLAAGVV